MRPNAIFLLAFLTLSSCDLKKYIDEQNGKVELQRITSEGYSIGIPTYMTKTTVLNHAASLQFQNLFKETYMIIIDEDKARFIKTFTELSSYDTTQSLVSNYASTQMQSLASKLEILSKKELKNLKINKLDTIAVEFDGKLEKIKVPITYFLTFIEGEQKMHMIMAWTSQDKKDIYRKTFNQMARSFKEQ